MTLLTALGKVHSTLKSLFIYLKKSRKRRLYRQWVESADLSPEDVPQEAAGKHTIPRIRIDKEKLRLPILFMLLGALLTILLIGLILLIVYSC
jgi:hypothetical protein